MTTQSSARPLPSFTLGDYLAKSRTWAGLSQQDMADRLLVSRTSVVNWENDHTSPTPRRLIAWAMATGVTVEWLRQGTVVRAHAYTDWSAGEPAQPTHNRHKSTPDWYSREAVRRKRNRARWRLEVALHAHFHNHKTMPPQPRSLFVVPALPAESSADAFIPSQRTRNHLEVAQ